MEGLIFWPVPEPWLINEMGPSQILAFYGMLYLSRTAKTEVGTKAAYQRPAPAPQLAGL